MDSKWEINMLPKEFNPAQIKLSKQDWSGLLDVARHAIKYGLSYHNPPYLELEKYPDTIKQQAASFVTLRESNVMRGCVGSVSAHLPLVQDVANHTFAAAFKDSRFASINHIEEPVVHIAISVISELVTINVDSELALISFIESFECGVVLSLDEKKATFLPEVWGDVDDGHEFLNRLKQNLDLPATYWSKELTIECYQVQTLE